MLKGLTTVDTFIKNAYVMTYIMFYIIEKQDQLDQLHIGEDTFIHLIPRQHSFIFL